MISPHDRFHTYVDGCSFTSGISDTINRSWWRNIPEITRSSAWPGKDNYSIFTDTLYTITNYPINRAIIYWTYPERFNLPYSDNGRVTNWPNKNIQQAFKIDTVFYDYVKMNLNYMFVIQELCKQKNIELFYITTLPYHYYEQGDNGLLTKIDSVANWPGPALNHSYHVWINSLQMLFGSYYNVIDNDGMHLNEEGHKLFYKHFIAPMLSKEEIQQPWSTHNTVNWAHNLDQSRLLTALANSRIKDLDSLQTNNTTGFVYEQV